jgi:DNA repair protein RadC
MNYTIKLVRFQMVREPGAPRRRVVTQPEDAFALVRELIVDDAKEHFWILLLDSQNGLVAAHHVSTGTLVASLVHAREVFGPALRVMGVASIILAHNHPSGDPSPSREDLALTRRLVEAGKMLEIRVHDHIIVGDGTDTWVSFAMRGLL